MRPWTQASAILFDWMRGNLWSRFEFQDLRLWIANSLQTGTKNSSVVCLSFKVPVEGKKESAARASIALRPLICGNRISRRAYVFAEVIRTPTMGNVVVPPDLEQVLGVLRIVETNDSASQSFMLPQTRSVVRLV